MQRRTLATALVMLTLGALLGRWSTVAVPSAVPPAASSSPVPPPTTVAAAPATPPLLGTATPPGDVAGLTILAIGNNPEASHPQQALLVEPNTGHKWLLTGLTASWNHDGTQIHTFYPGRECSGQIRNVGLDGLATGELEVYPSVYGSDPSDIHYSPDDSMIAYETFSASRGPCVFAKGGFRPGDDRGKDVLVRGFGARTLTFLHDVGIVPPISWAPDGSAFAATLVDPLHPAGNGRVVVVTLEGATTQVVYDGNLLDGKSPVGPPAWSPDGQWLAFIYGNRYKMWTLAICRPDGSDLWELAWIGGARHAVSWSPDSTQIALIGDGPGGTHDVDIVGTTKPPEYTGHPTGVVDARARSAWGVEIPPAWSPDGHWLLFTSSTGISRVSTAPPQFPDGLAERVDIPATDGLTAIGWPPAVP